MLFGAFFTAYFFIRVVKAPTWPAAGHEIPVLVAGINTAVLVSSSFTMHWALEGIKNGNTRALQRRAAHDVPAGPDVPLGPGQRVLPPRLGDPRQRAGHDLLRADGTARSPRHGRPDPARCSRTSGRSAATSRPRSTAASRCPGSTGTSSTSCGSSSSRRSTSSSAMWNPLRSERDMFRFLMQVGRRRAWR